MMEANSMLSSCRVLPEGRLRRSMTKASDWVPPSVPVITIGSLRELFVVVGMIVRTSSMVVVDSLVRKVLAPPIRSVSAVESRLSIAVISVFRASVLD